MNDRELRKKAIEMMKKSKPQDWTDILSQLIQIIVWLVPIGCIILLTASIPFYDSFTKAYQSEERLIRAVSRVDKELYYPEAVIDQWSDVSYQGVLDGRNIYAKLYGYKIAGTVGEQTEDYHIAIKGEVIRKPENAMYGGNREYRGVMYEIYLAGYEHQAVILRDEVMYTFFVSPCEVDRNLTPEDYQTEVVLVEWVEAFIEDLVK